MNEVVPKWIELVVRAIGNDQDMFGFILLGALQDSGQNRARAVNGRPRVKIGYSDLFVFTVYLCMAWPFPQILRALMPGIMPP